MPLPPLLTPEQFSIGTGGLVAASDPRVQPLIDGATTAIRRYCGWHIGGPYEEERFLDGSGGQVLRLPTLRLIEVTAISNDSTVLDTATLEWSEKGLLRLRHGCWTDRYRGVHVTFNHGYEDVSDVAQIIQQVVANAIASPMGATSESAGGLAVSWATTAPGVSGGISLLERDFQVLDSYRLEKGS